MQSRCLVACMAEQGAMRWGPRGRRVCIHAALLPWRAAAFAGIGCQRQRQRRGRGALLHSCTCQSPFAARTGFRRCNAIHFGREIGPLAPSPKEGGGAFRLPIPLGSSLLPPWKRLRQHTRHLHAVAQASVLRLARPSACHRDAGRAVVACRCAQARPYSQNPR